MDYMKFTLCRPRSGREGEKCRPVEHMRQILFIIIIIIIIVIVIIIIIIIIIIILNEYIFWGRDGISFFLIIRIWKCE